MKYIEDREPSINKTDVIEVTKDEELRLRKVLLEYLKHIRDDADVPDIEEIARDPITRMELVNSRNMGHHFKVRIVSKTELTPESNIATDDGKRSLLLRVANLIRGDWSGNVFDGRDVKRWIVAILDGKDISDELTAVEQEYTG